MGAEYSAEVVELGDQIAALSPSKAGDLVNYLKITYNIEPAFGPPSLEPQTETKKDEKPPEQTEFSVVLVGFEESKRIGLVKTYREISGKGLKESMDAVVMGTAAGLGLLVKEALPKEEALKLKATLEAAGGKVELK